MSVSSGGGREGAVEGTWGHGSVLEIYVQRTIAPRASPGFCRHLETFLMKPASSPVAVCMVGSCNQCGYQHDLRVELV